MHEPLTSVLPHSLCETLMLGLIGQRGFCLPMLTKQIQE